MTILVLSDSHSTLRFMRQCVQTHKPDVLKYKEIEQLKLVSDSK